MVLEYELIYSSSTPSTVVRTYTCTYSSIAILGTRLLFAFQSVVHHRSLSISQSHQVQRKQRRTRAGGRGGASLVQVPRCCRSCRHRARRAPSQPGAGPSCCGRGGRAHNSNSNRQLLRGRWCRSPVRCVTGKVTRSATRTHARTHARSRARVRPCATHRQQPRGRTDHLPSRRAVDFF